jgi:hypothetical protein
MGGRQLLGTGLPAPAIELLNGYAAILAMLPSDKLIPDLKVPSDGYLGTRQTEKDQFSLVRP